MKKDVIKDNRTGRIFWDDGMVRNFETVLERDISFAKAKEKYPNIEPIEPEWDDSISSDQLKSMDDTFTPVND